MAARVGGGVLLLAASFASTLTLATAKRREEEEGNEHNTSGHDGFQIFHVEWERVEVPFLVGVWILATTVSKLAFHLTPGLKRVLPESSVMILIGLIVGIIFFLANIKPTTLTPDIFFLFLLPPIIMEAGYFMPNRLFFDQLGTILLMAVVGTIFNMFVIGLALWGVGQLGWYTVTPDLMETLVFGSLIAAVDPVAVLAVFEEIKVDEVLNIVVFGESLLNDGVAVVLYHMFEQFADFEEAGKEISTKDIILGLVSFLVVAGGGTLIGIIWGYVCALTTRMMSGAKVLEPLVVLTMAYLSYLSAETFHMSGILAITFCGITMKNYVEKNVSENSSTTIRSAMHMLANAAEMTIFLFLGVFTITSQMQEEVNGNPSPDEQVRGAFKWDWVFIVMTILVCTVSRVLGVLILSAFANLFRITKLNGIEQIIMMYGGLRGGVAFALVISLDTKNDPIFLTATLAMVFWTVFFQGITIKPIVKLLKVKTRSNEQPTMVDRVTSRLMDLAKTGIMDILGDNSEIPSRIRTVYKNFDETFLKPILLKEKGSTEPKIFETFENLVRRDALNLAKTMMTKNNSDFLQLPQPDYILNTKFEPEKAHSDPAYENNGFSPDPDGSSDAHKK